MLREKHKHIDFLQIMSQKSSVERILRMLQIRHTLDDKYNTYLVVDHLISRETSTEGRNSSLSSYKVKSGG